MNLENLTPETIEKAKACKTAEELLALAKEEGVKLTLEQLEQISAGDIWGEAAAPFWSARIVVHGTWRSKDGMETAATTGARYADTAPTQMRLSGAPSHYQLYDP